MRMKTDGLHPEVNIFVRNHTTMDEKRVPQPLAAVPRLDQQISLSEWGARLEDHPLCSCHRFLSLHLEDAAHSTW